jgi:hypothetical protein
MTPTLRKLIVDAVVSAAINFIIRKAFEILESDMKALSEETEERQ